jgi:hypothetical protein
MIRTSAMLLLFAVGPASAQQFDMPRDTWLSNLKPVMTNGLCMGVGSPFLRIFQGSTENCVSEVSSLFEQCAHEEPRVVLPEKLTSIPQANTYGQIMAECISAHYQKGAALEAFYMLQDLTNKQSH